MKKRLIPIVAAGLAAALVASQALASGSVSVSFPMKAKVTTRATATGCSNNPGPFISLEGEISLGGLEAILRFSNNMKGTHEHLEDIVTNVTLSTDEPIRFAKQPPEGGAGGNPYVYLQLTDCETGEPTGNPIKLGRCVQGLKTTSLDLLVDAFAEATITSGSCENSPGPFISLEGELSLGGVCATLIFSNNSRMTHVHEEDVTVAIVLIPPGESITFAKQPPEGGVGGNPHIFLQLLTGGEPIGGEIYIGRCVQLE